MEKTTLKTVKNLLQYLPEKDIPLCESLLDKGDYNAVKEIIHSDIIKAKKREDLNEKPLVKDLSGLIELEVMFLDYCSIKGIFDNE